MFRILAAIATALLKMTWGLLSFGWQAINVPFAWLDRAIFGAPTATPPGNLEAALPSVDDVEAARFTAKTEAKAASAIQSLTPALQVARYAAASADARFDVDLGLLSAKQRAWLRGLSDRDLHVIHQVDLKKIDRALRGESFVLPGIDSVEQNDAQAETEIGRRLRLVRSLRSERDHGMSM